MAELFTANGVNLTVDVALFDTVAALVDAYSDPSLVLTAKVDGVLIDRDEPLPDGVSVIEIVAPPAPAEPSTRVNKGLLYREVERIPQPHLPVRSAYPQ